MATKRVSLKHARNRLLTIWGLACAIPVILLIIFTMLDKFDGVEEQVWGWFSPLIFPTFTLMLGVLGASAVSSGSQERKTVDWFFLKLSSWLSLIYLLVVLLVIIMENFSLKPPVKLFTTANFFLTPVQALATTAIGVLFATSNEGKADPEIPKPKQSGELATPNTN